LAKNGNVLFIIRSKITKMINESQVNLSIIFIFLGALDFHA